jgi:chromosome segregation ATPase
MEEALRLAQEESRLLTQRERAARSQGAAGSAALEQDLEALRAEVRMRVSQGAELRARVAESNSARDALAGELAAAREREQACIQARKDNAARLRDLQWGNETLLQEIESLENHLRRLESDGNECELRKTAN